ncbi:MAG: nitroreductase family deazaflavin-dependent oxidoreductase [Acidimicrobiia bacterium]|nr:nitroreductase family deazaflavin-dependent oxidoreductase [Acidimicrobiia bacterium]
MSDWNTNVIEEFRTNGGTVGGPFDGDTLLLLHHRGAKSGTERITPLLYRREADRIFIFASKGGDPRHPAWYHNIVANPEVTVEVGTETMSATAVEITGPERDEIYGRQAAEQPSRFGVYQENTERTIPVIELVPA